MTENSVMLWGWDSVTSTWVKILVNSAGKLIIDTSEIFEDPPTDGETAKAPNSNWAFDHVTDKTILTAIGDMIYASAISTPAKLAIGNAGYILTVSGGLPVWAAPTGGGPTLVRKTVDEDLVSSTVMQNDDELKFTVAGSEVWEFLLYLLLSAASSTPDFKYQFTIPAAGTLYKNTVWEAITATGVVDGTASSGSVALVVGIRYLMLRYLYIGGANGGTVQLQWAQNTSSADKMTVKANSFIVAHKLS